ncbi:MAG: DivIVA domain-containing protein [Firmicutes bacterium]|nr:DivIVA domain-containing protein [Bacillota bacterium]
MITPADIENKEFSRVKKGYSEEEVDEFLDLIIVDMEKLIRENHQLKNELSKAHTQVDKHMSTETSIYETLESARSLMNDIAASAERRAEILLKNAELEASLITREAKESIAKYTEEGNKIKNRVDMLKERYRRMLEAEMERLEFSGADILEDFEKDFLPASMTAADKVSELEAAEAAEGLTAQHEAVKVQPVSEEAPDLTKTMVHIR